MHRTITIIIITHQMMLSKWPLQLPAGRQRMHTQTTDVNGEWQQRSASQTNGVVCWWRVNELAAIGELLPEWLLLPSFFFPAVQHDNIFREEEAK
jgi:hypothetical protein